MDIVTKETFKTKLQKLVEHFSDNEDYYKSTQYKEDHVRQEFINPFFKALGWDMDNEQGFAPQYREVIHEDRLEIEGKPKAPDYAFKVGSDRKFFVEAKASSVKVFSEIDPAFQLRRYAWSGKLPVSILTDFEEFSIYDTTIEPKHTDKSSVARVKYIHYKDYIKEADYLWDTFSKEAVWKGSFDKFAKREKKGSQLVDKSFLKEIELWRDLVAKDIASNNKLNIYELNFVVQKFIDRIIFLRIAEDRGVETYETLRSAIKSPNTYSQLLKIFSRADEKYNSSLFDLKKDELSAKIKISDKTLDKILNNLYYPKSPYEFSVIGVDILGSVYEQFLGKVIRLTKGGNAVIEEKPEVKKAGGVYYTPQYIVDYIVKNTVGELVEGKTPKDVAKLKIVDPACGSGSFLIGAYNYLLNWHHKYYVENDVEKNLKAKKLFKDAEGNFFLSTQEKKDILLNNIHGVDIDPQAVEVTKLSLALKMLEGENSETIGAQFVMFADRILPDLSSNIKCGNSLIGSDYYSDKQITLLGDEELRKVNAFDWDKEFPLVFRYGGFDAVIGNPPYVQMQRTDLEDRKAFKRLYPDFYKSQIDLWYLFIKKGKEILKDSGLLSFITSNYYIGATHADLLRRFICENFSINEILDFGSEKIFANANVHSAIIKLKKKIVAESKLRYCRVTSEFESIENLKFSLVSQQNLNSSPWTFIDGREEKLFRKLLEDTIPLKEIAQIGTGVKSGFDKIFVVDQSIVEKYELETECLRKWVKNSEIRRYSIKWGGKYIIYTYKGIVIDKYPHIKDYLERSKLDLVNRWSKRGENFNWYELYRGREYLFFDTENEILCPYKSKENNFASNDSNYTGSGDIYAIKINEGYDLIVILAFLNSRLGNYIYSKIGKKKGSLNEYYTEPLSEIPIKKNIEHQISSQLGILVSKLEGLKKVISEEKVESKIKIVEYEITILEKKIDTLIYKIYNLSDEEIKTLEEECNKKTH